MNGTPIPGVRGVRVDGPTEELPRVVVEIPGDVSVDVEGVTVAMPPPAADTDELDAILDAIDPGILDREVLENASLGDVGGGAAEYIAAIRRYVRGD